MIIILIVSSDLQETIIKKFNKTDGIHYTFFNPVYGKGNSGMRFNRDFAPGENTMFLMDTSDTETIARIERIIEEINSNRKPKQGVHVIRINNRYLDGKV